MLFRRIVAMCGLRNISIQHCRNNQHRHFASTQSNKSTIYALSSAPGKSGVAVIRVSGGASGDVIMKMTKSQTFPKPRRATVTNIFNHHTGEHLDKAMVVWFPGPHSFTGEDVCELHVHGGNAVVSSVFRALSELPGLNHAEAGEYTKRAFLNGKLDLTEVEGLGDLIHAETEEQRKQALKQMDGLLKSVVETWGKDLLNCLAHLEAYIDFGEDQHIDDDVIDDVTAKINSLAVKIQEHLNDKRRGELLRSGVRLAIIGKPNVGKSSLLNLLTAKQTAIVSPIAGTTRDVLQSTIDVNGFPVIISDTAGIRHTTDVIETEGVRRAKEAASTADLVVFVIDAGDVIRSNATKYLKSINEQLDCINENQLTLIAINKIDLMTSSEIEILKSSLENCDLDATVTNLSCITQTGFEQFLNDLSHQVKVLCLGDDSSRFSPSLTQERHRAHVANCLTELCHCQSVLKDDVVIAAEHLRLAMNNLGKLTGKVGAEDILDVIFRDFCIGK